MIGVVESLLYAQQAGMDAHQVIDVIGKGAASSWSINTLGRRIADGDFDPGFYIKHFVKDMGIALDEARRMRPVPSRSGPGPPVLCGGHGHGMGKPGHPGPLSRVEYHESLNRPGGVRPSAGQMPLPLQPGYKQTRSGFWSVDDPVTKTKGVFVQLPEFFQGQLEVNGSRKDGEPGAEGVG